MLLDQEDAEDDVYCFVRFKKGKNAKSQVCVGFVTGVLAAVFLVANYGADMHKFHDFTVTYISPHETVVFNSTTIVRYDAAGVQVEMFRNVPPLSFQAPLFIAANDTCATMTVTSDAEPLGCVLIGVLSFWSFLVLVLDFTALFGEGVQMASALVASLVFVVLDLVTSIGAFIAVTLQGGRHRASPPGAPCMLTMLVAALVAGLVLHISALPTHHHHPSPDAALPLVLLDAVSCLFVVFTAVTFAVHGCHHDQADDRGDEDIRAGARRPHPLSRVV